MHLSPAIAAFVLLCAGGKTVVAAEAAPDAAEIMFQRGLADMLAARYASGCPAIAESLRLDPRPGTLFTLAECESRAGLVGSALRHYDDFLRLVSGLPPEAAHRQREREHIATEQRARLAAIAPSMIITVSGEAPPGTVITRDGAPVPVPELGVAVPIDPGRHAIRLTTPDSRSFERDVVAALNQRLEVNLSTPEPAAAKVALPIASVPVTPLEARLPNQGPTWLRRRRWEIGLAIAGAAMALGGGASFWIAKDKVDAINSARASGHPFDVETGNYRTYEVLGTTLAASAGAAFASAAALWLTEGRLGRGSAPTASVSAAISADGIGAAVRGSF